MKTATREVLTFVAAQCVAYAEASELGRTLLPLTPMHRFAFVVLAKELRKRARPSPSSEKQRGNKT